jgi:orotate phosphoribosyltransferase
MGRQLGLPACFTERDSQGLMRLRRGFELKPGQRILIVEDVVTTGKSSGECTEALEEWGGVITAFSCVVDRRGPHIRLPRPLYAACKVEARDWDPEDCELCRRGIPAVKPGSRTR